MVDLLCFADRTLFCNRFMPNVRLGGGCLNPARFYNSSCGRAGGGLCSSCRLSSSVFFIRQFHGIDLPSVRSSSIVGGDRDRKRVFFEKPTTPFSSTAEVSLADEETQVTSRLSSLSLSSPWLMVPPGLVSNFPNEEEEEEAAAAFENDYFHLYNVLEKKMLKLKRDNKIRLPWQRDVLSANEAICVGSSHGWLAFVHPHNCSLFLFNPLLSSSSQFPYLPLPPVESLPYVISSVRRCKEKNSSSSIVTEYTVPWYKSVSPVSSQELGDHILETLILSSAPFPFLSNHRDHHQVQDIMAMAIVGYRLAFCRLGDAAWTTLEGPPCYQPLYFSKDQRFYALSKMESLVAWDLRDPASPKWSLITHVPPPENQPTMDEWQRHLRNYFCRPPFRKLYLVESCSGDLLMVIRHPYRYHYADAFKAAAFDVYKLDFVHKKWIYVTCLGDEALFVGENGSFSISASNFPGVSKNSIYFTPFGFEFQDDYNNEDMGIFNLEDGSITPFFHPDPDFKKNRLPPFWIILQPQP